MYVFMGVNTCLQASANKWTPIVAYTTQTCEHTCVRTCTCPQVEIELCLPSPALGVHDGALGVHDETLGVHDGTLSVHDAALGIQEETLGVHYETLGVHDAALGVHEETLGVHDDRDSMPANSGSRRA